MSLISHHTRKRNTRKFFPFRKKKLPVRVMTVEVIYLNWDPLAISTANNANACYFISFTFSLFFPSISFQTFANALRIKGSDWLRAHRQENPPYHLVTRNFTQSFEIFNSQIFTNGVNTSFTKQVRGTKMTKLTASKTHYFHWTFVHEFNTESHE